MIRRNRMKIMAALAVLVMTMVCIIPVNDSENGLDAAVGDGGSYTYTIAYDSSLMSTTSAAISVANMTAINHMGTPTTVSILNEGSWTWNTTTGRGPFNSFYAAFDMQNGNAYYAVLNPYNLTKTITGEDLPAPLTRWNIMWVLPTVYIKSTANSLTLTNDSTAGGTAYAHTINGHVYKYVAIGVYEGSTTTLNNQTVLTSTTGTMPAANATRATFRGYAHNYAMSSTLNESSSYPAYSMLWNYDQWQLFKDICFATMEDFNSENTVGNGHAFTNNSTYSYQTGALNTMGPYAGLPAKITDEVTALSYGSDSVKLFIENAWGGVLDFVDGAVFDGRTGVYLDSSSNPTDAHTGTYVTYHQWPTAIQNGYPISIQTDNARVWGFQGSTVGGSDTTGTADYIWTSADADRVLGVGGGAWSGWGNSVRSGVSSSYVPAALSYADASLGARLAFVFDAGPASTVTATIDPSGYGSLSNGVQTSQPTISVAGVPYASNVTVSENTLTANGTTITATPTTATAQYTYTFDGWYQGATKITSSQMILKDTAITAKFTRAVNNYNVTISSNNTSYGTVTNSSFSSIPYGQTFTVNGTTLSIYGQSTVANKTSDTLDYSYGFSGFYIDDTLVTTGTQISSNVTIQARFTQTPILWDVGIQSNNTAYGTVSPAQVLDVPGGSYFSVSGTTLTINNTPITATKHADDDHWIYSFDGWYDALTGGNPITASTRVTSDMNVYARFSQTLATHTALVESSNINYGTVSVGSLTNIPYGETFTVTGNTLSIYNQSVVALATEDTVRYEYSFDGFETEGIPIVTGMAMTSDMTIRAVFSSTELLYTVIISSNNTDYGDVDVKSITGVPGGSSFTVNGNELELAGTTVRATKTTDNAQYTYGFAGWYDALTGGNEITSLTTVTSNMNVYARFTATVNNYTVTIQDDGSGYGSVSQASITNVPYGTNITINGQSINVNGTPVTASTLNDTDQYDYAFINWTVNGTPVSASYQVQGNVTIQANFDRYTKTYDVNFSVNEPTYGTVSRNIIQSVPYGESYTVNGNVLTLYNNTVTATPVNNAQYLGSLVGWFDAPTGGNEITDLSTVTGEAMIYARFTASIKEYTVTIQSNDDEYGTVSASSVSNVPYGTSITVNGQALTVNGTPITATAETDDDQYHYSFVNWTVSNTPITTSYTVQGNVTIKANFSREMKTYNVNFSTNNNDYGSVSLSFINDVPYGTNFVVNANKVRLNTTTVTATPVNNQQYLSTFVGWYDALIGGNPITDETEIHGNMTVYARFTATVKEYTINIQSNNTAYGTVSPTALTNVPYGTPIQVNGQSLIINGTTIYALETPPTEDYNYYMESWSVTDGTMVQGNMIITATFVEGTPPDRFTLRYNLQGGQGYFPEQVHWKEGEETAYTFVIPESEPTRNGFDFLGWATSSDATSGEYEPGDTITVEAGRIVVLYAVWDETTAFSIMAIIPILAAVGLLAGSAMIFINGRKDDIGGEEEEGATVMNILGVVLAVIAIACIMVPIIGGF